MASGNFFAGEFFGGGFFGVNPLSATPGWLVRDYLLWRAQREHLLSVAAIREEQEALEIAAEAQEVVARLATFERIGRPERELRAALESARIRYREEYLEYLYLEMRANEIRRQEEEAIAMTIIVLLS